MHRQGFLWLQVIAAWTCVLPVLADSSYVGSNNCIECHQEQGADWRKSDHFHAMELPSEETVLGDFSDVTVSFHGASTRLYRQTGEYRIDVTEADNAPESFEVKYTFGHYPLQQYLVDVGNGHLQALNVAWDSRTEEEGGQRWFHLQPDEAITPDHPFHWKSHFQNWNARCSDCHSTNLSRNYDVSSNSFSTTWSELTVGCEACHGPGESHVSRVNAGTYANDNTGLVFGRPGRLQWQFQPGNPIATPSGKQDDRHINMCGACHSLRTPIARYEPGQGFHDANRIRLLDQLTYFLDGQIREEVYVLGSFLQSKMYEQGVTCTNCHNPHSGKLIAEGNGLCAQCHRADVYDTPDHHHHPAETAGAQCVSCHMPERTYMQVDDRRDHSFTIPRPSLSKDLGVPNACTQCHADRTDDWAQQSLASWGVEETPQHWAYLSARAQNGEIGVTRELANRISEQDLPAMVRGSLISQMAGMPSRVSLEAALAQLQSEDPLARRGAVDAMVSLPPDVRWQVLSRHLNDPSRSVRMAIASAVADLYIQLPQGEQDKLHPLIIEYRDSLKLNLDSPAGQLSMAALELQLDNPFAAREGYLNALRIEPDFVPALLNLADYYRQQGVDEKAEEHLLRALEVAPDSAAANHSFGLFLVRQQDYPAAIPYLGNAVNQADAVPRYAFVHAVALESTGQLDTAIEALTLANRRWPDQFDLLMLQIQYLEKAGRESEVLGYLSSLSRLAPASPDVQKLVKKYAGQ